MSIIVVPLDGSEFAEAALRVARAVARENGGPARCWSASPPTATAEADDQYLQHVAAGIDDVPVSTVLSMARAGPAGRRRHRGRRHRCRSRRHGLHDGPRPHRPGGGGAGQHHRGPPAAPRTVRSWWSAATAHRSWPEQRRLLVPLDGSARSEQILPEVAGVATDWGLEPWLLQVVHPFYSEMSQHLDTTLVGAQRAAARSRRGRQDGLPVRLQRRRWPSTSRPEALGAALIMMSSYVHPGMARTLLGSVTMQVVHGAPCPVLVCPHPDDEDTT